MTRAWPGALLALQAFLIVLAARPGWRDDLWGFNFPSFLPAGTLALIGVLAIGLMIALRLGRPRGRWGTLLAGLIITAIVVMLRDTTHLLGDGQLWLAAVREAPAHHPHEPFAFALSSVVAGADTTGTRLAWLSHALGMATLALLWILAGRLLPPSPDGMARRWAFAVMATAGASLFAFGYVEAYPALGLAVVGLLVALIGWLEGRNGAAVVGLLFGLAVGTHALALALGPAVLLAFWWRRPTASRLLAAALLALVPIAVAWVVLPLVLPAGGLSESGRHWSQLLGELAVYRWGVGSWCLDQLNRWGLAAGSGLFVLVAALPSMWGARRGAGAPGGAGGAVWVLAVAALGLAAPALVLDTEGSRGAAADWDAVAVAGWPLAALAALGFVRPRPAAAASPTGTTGDHVRTGPGRPGFLLWSMPTVALFGLLSAAAVAHDPEAAVARFESLITGSFKTARARSWGWETLAAWRRGTGDMVGAATSYAAALAEQPRNIRLLRNAAGAWGRVGQARRTADVLVRLTAEAPEDAGAWRHLGMELERVGSADSSRAALRRSIELDPNGVDARNELARSLLRHSDTRPEARVLIARSLELAPGQPHAAELRGMLDRLDRDGYGPAAP